MSILVALAIFGVKDVVHYQQVQNDKHDQCQIEVKEQQVAFILVLDIIHEEKLDNDLVEVLAQYLVFPQIHDLVAESKSDKLQCFNYK